MSSCAGHVTMETVFGQTLALWLGNGHEHRALESDTTGLSVKGNLYFYLRILWDKFTYGVFNWMPFWMDHGPHFFFAVILANYSLAMFTQAHHAFTEVGRKEWHVILFPIQSGT